MFFQNQNDRPKTPQNAAFSNNSSLTFCVYKHTVIGVNKEHKRKEIDMRSVQAACIFAIMGVFPFYGALSEETDAKLEKMIREMNNPTVRIVTSDKAQGSGSIIFSGYRSAAKGGSEFLSAETCILTNYHIVKDSLRKSLKGLTNKSIRTHTGISVTVNLFEFGPTTDMISERSFSAALVAIDAKEDLALVCTRDAGVVPYVAALAPRGTKLRRNDSAWAVGSPLGLPPILTEGRFAHTFPRAKAESEAIGTFWGSLATSPIFAGNSGGGLYQYSSLNKRYELVAVTSGFPVSDVGNANYIVVSVTLEMIYRFLKESGYSFIIDAQNGVRE